MGEVITFWVPWTLIMLALAVLFWPGRGLFWRQRRSKEERERIQVEDALKYLYFCEREQRRPTVAGIAGRMQVSENRAAHISQELQEMGFAVMQGDVIKLTGDGRAYALHIVRAHRLWERHLADETGYAEREWHARAEQAEHSLTPEEADALAARLRNPLRDPHGDPIPNEDGSFRSKSGDPLSDAPTGFNFTIERVLDQSPDFLRYLTEGGVLIGTTAVVVDNHRSAGVITVRIGDRNLSMSREVARNIIVHENKS